MSVQTWKRGNNDLKMFVDAQEFAIYFLKITANEEVFKPMFKETITDRLNHLAMDIYLNMWKANNIKLSNDKLKQRQSFQILALQNITDFLALYNLAIRAFHLKHKRTEYIVGKILDIEEAIKKWCKNDIKRLKAIDKKENETV